jgi:hypothetical protein
MALFKKKADPISDRARMLNDEIAALEAQIKKLDTQLHQNQSHPRLRSTAIPHGHTVSHVSEPPVTLTATEPIFEEVNQNRLNARSENGNGTTREHYNDLGVRKYDLPAFLRRLRNQFSGPSTTNPKLVSYLAAGGIQGLRPLRYEKRVARNRLFFWVVIIFATLLGTVVVYFNNR